MFDEIIYYRDSALAYARRWARDRNPKYMDFEKLGGDCTNFASQCLYTGCDIMNYAPPLKWYYNSPTDRAPSWSGVHFFWEFLLNNKSAGPYGALVEPSLLLPADFIQLSDGKRYHHTLIVVDVSGCDMLLAAHSRDAYAAPLSAYTYESIRYIKIAGIRGSVKK